MSLIDAMSIAQTGMSAAMTQLNVSANNIANSDTAGYVPERVDFYSAGDGDGVETSVRDVGGSVDVANELVNADRAKLLYGANAAVIRTADRMLGSLLDIFDDGSSGGRDDG